MTDAIRIFTFFHPFLIDPTQIVRHQFLGGDRSKILFANPYLPAPEDILATSIPDGQHDISLMDVFGSDIELNIGIISATDQFQIVSPILDDFVIGFSILPDENGIRGGIRYIHKYVRRRDGLVLRIEEMLRHIDIVIRLLGASGIVPHPIPVAIKRSSAAIRIICTLVVRAIRDRIAIDNRELVPSRCGNHIGVGCSLGMSDAMDVVHRKIIGISRGSLGFPVPKDCPGNVFGGKGLLGKIGIRPDDIRSTVFTGRTAESRCGTRKIGEHEVRMAVRLAGTVRSVILAVCDVPGHSYLVAGVADGILVTDDFEGDVGDGIVADKHSIADLFKDIHPFARHHIGNDILPRALEGMPYKLIGHLIFKTEHFLGAAGVFQRDLDTIQVDREGQEGEIQDTVIRDGDTAVTKADSNLIASPGKRGAIRTGKSLVPSGAAAISRLAQDLEPEVAGKGSMDIRTIHCDRLRLQIGAHDRGIGIAGFPDELELEGRESRFEVKLDRRGGRTGVNKLVGGKIAIMLRIRLILVIGIAG